MQMSGWGGDDHLQAVMFTALQSFSVRRNVQAAMADQLIVLNFLRSSSERFFQDSPSAQYHLHLQLGNSTKFHTRFQPGPHFLQFHFYLLDRFHAQQVSKKEDHDTHKWDIHQRGLEQWLYFLKRCTRELVEKQ
jgi:hypothetical protein